jgi:hypothetical protein
MDFNALSTLEPKITMQDRRYCYETGLQILLQSNRVLLESHLHSRKCTVLALNAVDLKGSMLAFKTPFGLRRAR